MAKSDFDPLGMETPVVDLQALDKLAWIGSRHHWKNAVEVGSWAGRTALVISGHFSRTFCVDNWEGSPWERVIRPWTPRQAFQAFCRNMGDRLCTEVFPCVGRSLTWAATWHGPLGLVYLDADHRYEAVRADIEAWMPLVSPGGVICGHDHHEDFPGVVRAVDELLPDRQLAGFSIWYVIKEIECEAGSSSPPTRVWNDDALPKPRATASPPR